MTRKNPRKTYGIEYLRSIMAGTGGGTRWENNAAFKNAASFTANLMTRVGARKMLDVGCGRGWVVFNLRQLGFDAQGCEYGNEAIDYSKCGAQKCDLTVPRGLPYEDESFDHVNCVGVLSHLPAEDAPCALKEMYRVNRGTLWTNILVLRQDGSLNPSAEHHLNQTTSEWWENLFASEGWKNITNQYSDLYRAHGFGSTPQQMGRIWRKR
jgi:SAM-dependent methyltransferase